MGDAADMLLDGTLDFHTGEYLDGNSPGYPRSNSWRFASLKEKIRNSFMPYKEEHEIPWKPGKVVLLPNKEDIRDCIYVEASLVGDNRKYLNYVVVDQHSYTKGKKRTGFKRWMVFHKNQIKS